jgi:hypothetical protein
MKIASIFSILFITFTSHHVFAWGDMGHKITAAIAEQTVSAKTKDFIRGILGVEPFANAAVWPDLSRDDARFAKRNGGNNDFGPYHFCEIPTGHDYKSNPHKSEKDAYGAIVNSQKILTGKYSREEKILALRYLIHVVGDVHQPLHVGNGFDLGANACQIKWRNSQMNLHSFWDDEMVRHVGYTYAKETVNKKPAKYLNDYLNVLKKKYPESFTLAAKEKQSTGSAGVEKWLMESQNIRESGVYPDNPDTMKDVKKGEEHKYRPYCDWFIDQEKGVKAPGSKIDFNKLPTLDAANYADKFVPVIEGQWLKGGLRLAKVLDEIADAALKAGADSIDESKEAEIIKNVQDALKN